MSDFSDAQITSAIVNSYYEKLNKHLVSDVLIAGAGPAGLTAAALLADEGKNVTVLEKRLAPGGGIWGGGMGMNEAVVQENALSVLDRFDIAYKPAETQGLYTVSTIQLATRLCAAASEAGATILNLFTADDICVVDSRVTGLVANHSRVSGALPVDPITFQADTVIDGTGHDAVVVNAVRNQEGLSLSHTPKGQGPMNAGEGEAFVVDNACEIFPGLWIAGMSVCASLGGARMGPIFGGMLLSGEKVSGDILVQTK